MSNGFYSSRAAEANQERIVQLIFKIKPDYNLLKICDQHGRNVFHHAGKNLDVLLQLVFENIRVRVSISLNWKTKHLQVKKYHKHIVRPTSDLPSKGLIGLFLLRYRPYSLGGFLRPLLSQKTALLSSVMVSWPCFSKLHSSSIIQCIVLKCEYYKDL